MMKRLGLALVLMAGVMSFALPADAEPSSSSDEVSHRLTRKGSAGHIDVRAGRRHFPKDAEVSLTRTHAESAKRKIKDGLKKRHNVLAMYDISIKAGGRKWQPDAGDPVRVTVDLDEPVAVAATSSLGVAHLSDDGAVEELPASRYGFTYNADRTAVTSFWVDADGFSIYTIIDTDGNVQTGRRFYHFYEHSTTNGAGVNIALPYQYRDQSNDVVNVQIVKDGDMLKEPPIPRDIVDENDEVISIFEGWYVVSSNARPASVVESKLDNTNEYFQFVWPVGVTDMRMSFTNAVTVTETEDWDYYVVPLYENARFLQFNENAKTETEQGAGARIIRRKLVAINDETGVATLKVSDVEAALKNSLDEYFCGWEYLDTDGQYKPLLVYSELGKPQDTYITVSDALFEANGGSVIPLYPYYVSAHFLHFDSNAGGAHAKYVGSVFVRSSSNFSAVETSGERKGYNFAGWRAGFKDETTKEIRFAEMVTDANGNFIPNVSVTNDAGAVAFYTDANGNIRMNEDVTLYGTWAANTDASYRVIVWQQRATDSKNATDAEKKYYYVTHYTSPVVPATTQIAESLITSFTGTAAHGTNPNGSNLTAISGTSNLTGEDFTGFHYGRWECKDVTVAPDASTVINIYYDRDLITIQFNVDGYVVSTVDYYIYTVHTTTTANGSGASGTSGNSNTQYWYLKSDGTYARIYYRNSRYRTEDKNNGATYNNGTVYTRSTNTTAQYGTNNGSTYFRIYYVNNAWRTSNTTNGTVYNGTRYVSSSQVSYATMTGLYGQTLAANNYTWPTEYWWNGTNGDSGRTTFLDSFLADRTYVGASPENTSKTVYFYKQGVDGNYDDNNPANTVMIGNSGFRITDKYSGFKAVQYKEDNGNWQNTTVTSTSSAITEYNTADSFNSTLRIRFERNKNELIYQFTDDNGDHILRDTGKVVPFEAPLTAYDIAYTNLNWSGCDITNRTFAGWYEDASLTKEFDFNGTMPDNKKIIYAKWSPLQHKVIIDPNGGELIANDSTWFYVDPEKNETIKEYHPTRDYRLDMHNGTYYYHYDPWDPLGDKHVTDTNSPSFIPNISRRAYYTLDIAQATSNEFSNPVNRYTYDPGAYAFMGWYEVLADGTLATDPFSFGEPPTRNVTLRAIWRRMGVYTLKYESIDPDGRQATSILYDPQQNATGNIEDGYVADAETTLTKAPANYDKEQWLWEGWQVIDTYNNNIPLTTIRSPGDVYIVRASHADLNNVIHLRAVFKHIGDSTSRHVPPVTDLILDSNENAGLAAGATVTPVTGRVGTYTDGSNVSVGGLNQGVWFAGQQNNFSVNLEDYTSDFAHNNGYFLLGWDPHRDLASLIPEHYANETIGIDKETGMENILYAVWEPQIYIEFVNDTGAELKDVSLYIPGWTDGELFRVNSVQDTYRREKFAAFSQGTATFDIPDGERICLVLPDAADKDFAVMGACTYVEGNKLVVTRIQPQIEGQETIPDVTQSVYPGEDYMVSGTMKVSPTPVQVRFTNDTYQTTMDVPVRYFIHHPDGSVEEITADNATVANGDSTVAAWGSQKPLKTISNLGVATNDLAATLRYSTSLGVKGFLATEVQNEYGHTTIGIGSKSAVVTSENFSECEYRTITNIRGQPSGGSYLRFAREDLMWSRYSQIWNEYDATDTAVYVAFYKRIPVHVTLQKTVVGSEEDKDVPFTFTATYSEHSTNIEYTVTHTYTQTRVWTRQRRDLIGLFWTDWEAQGDWSEPVWGSAAQTNVTGRQLGVDTNLFDQLRSPETIVLKDGGRHPFTIFYDRADPMTGTTESHVDGKKPNESGSGASGGSYTQTRTGTQVVTYNAAYRYETVTIQEEGNPNYVLTAIGGDPLSQQAGHSGQADLNQRTYTISSLHDIQHGANNPNYYDYTPLDTTVFTNTRKTGSVTVTKTVVNGDAGDTFPFTVTLGETVVGKDTYTPPAGVHLGPYGKVFTFTLANNGSMTLSGLPAGASYTVEEGAHAKYVATIPANATGTIEADATITVGVTNTRKTDIVIVMNGVTNYFNGAEQFGYDITTVTGTGSPVVTDGYTVTGLKAGHVLTVEHHVPSHGTAVGEYTGDFSNARYTILDAGGNDVTQEYLVTTPVADTMTIKGTPVIVEITGNTSTVTYDGEEHVCQGYTNVVKNAVTSKLIENESVLIAVDPNYQQVYRTDVGKVEMPLEGHVNVTLPEGFTLQEVAVVSKGYLEITPKDVTVTANDASKLPGAAEPTYTATVSGTIGGDTLNYTISRTESGEAIGEYAIMPAGEASQGNYTVTYVAGKLAITNPSLTQRSTGSDLTVDGVAFTPEFLASSGFPSDVTPDEINEVMNSVDVNGLMRWENLRLGLATNQVPLGTETGTSDGTVSVGTPPPTETPVDWGYDVLYDLRKRNESDSSWSRVAGPVSSSGSDKLGIELVDAQGNSTKPTGLYRLYTLLVPRQNLSVTNEIPATNIIGVLEVESPVTNTITAVPWKQLASDPAKAIDITVSNYVAGVNISSGDVVYKLDADARYYTMWTRESDGTWGSVTTIASAMDGSGPVVRQAPEAETEPLQRGNAAWVKRTDTTKPYFLVGQYDEAEITVEVPGKTDAGAGLALIAVPTFKPLYLNKPDDYDGTQAYIDWSKFPVDANDQIRVPGNGVQTSLTYQNGKWGSYVTTTTWNEKRKKYVISSAFTPYTGIIPAGTGFFYFRMAGEGFTFSWK